MDGNWCFMNSELQFWEMKKFLEMDNGDGFTTV